ncbi:MAG: hypothetical protein AAF519_05760 [Bacteroidota bacterium]
MNLSLAQEEQVLESISSAEFKRVPYSYLNIEDYEMKLMFKARQPIYNQYEGISGGNLSIEAKLSRSFSFEGGYIIPAREFHSVFGRLRYYVKKSKKSGGINNLVGSHFLLGAKKSYEVRENHTVYQGIYPNDLELAVGYGYQGKVGRFGYYNALAQIYYSLDRKTTYGALRIDAGFGYGVAHRPEKSHKVLNPASLEPRKLGLLKISNIGFSWGDEQQGLGLELAYERLLWKDLTIEGSFTGSLGKLRVPYFDGTRSTFEFRRFFTDLNVRYYYNQKKRLRLGKISGSFGGPYILVGIDNIFNNSDQNIFLAEPRNFDRSFFHEITYKVAWGYQQPIGQRGFVDFNIGPYFNQDYGFHVATDVNIGLRF